MNRDQKWIARHFSELVDKYAGQYVAVVEEKVVANGKSAREVEEEAKEKCSVTIPSVVLVPKQEDLLHVL